MKKENTVYLTKPGGAFRRFAAYIFDSLILQVFTCLVGLTLHGKWDYYYEKWSSMGKIYTDRLQGLDLEEMIITIVGIAYFIYFEQSKLQGTLGKKLCNLQVVDLKGNRISFWRSGLRWFWCLVPTLPLYLLYIKMTFVIFVSIAWPILLCIWFLPVIFTKNKVGLHDLFSKTRVRYCGKFNMASQQANNFRT